MPHSRPRRAGEMWTCPPHSTSAFERPSDRKSCSGPGLADACARHRHLSREAFSDGSSATSDAGRARSDGPVTAVTVSDHSSGSQPWQCQAQIRSVIVVAITIVVIWQERMGPNYAGPWRRRRGPWAHAQPPTPDTHTPARSKPYWNLGTHVCSYSTDRNRTETRSCMHLRTVPYSISHGGEEQTEKQRARRARRGSVDAGPAVEDPRHRSRSHHLCAYVREIR